MKFCPKCGSKNINSPLPQDMAKYECKDCGYFGVFIIDDGIIAEEIHKEYLRNQNKTEK